MTTYDADLHAKNIAAINERNDKADETRQGFRMLGFHNGKFNIGRRTDLTGEAKVEYDRGYWAGKIAFEYSGAVATRQINPDRLEQDASKARSMNFWPTARPNPLE